MRAAVVALVAAVSATAGSPTPGAAAAGPAFAVDASKVQAPFRKLWLSGVGSGHASMSMRADWRRTLERAALEIGVKQVRFHGIFDDDMSSYLPGKGAGKAGSNMFNAFSTMDFLEDIGMSPLVELSFMPRELMATPQDEVPSTVMHYRGIRSPPKSWDDWEAFVEEFMGQVWGRYQAPFIVETWNEPNCGFYIGDGCNGTSGNQTAYFELYKHTSEAIARASPGFRPAGPVTAQLQWIDEFLTWAVDEGNAPVSIVTSHLYPTDPVVNASDRLGWEAKVAEAAGLAAKRGLNFTLSEFNAGLYRDPDARDGPYTSAFLGHLAYSSQLLPSNVEGLSFWSFSDIFEEPGFVSAPFHGGFGMATVHDINKPAWCAMALLSRHGDRALQASVGGVQSPTPGATSGSVDLAATLRDDGGIVVSLASFEPFNSPAPAAQTVNVTLSGLPSAPGPRDVAAFRVDADNCNPLTDWKQAGSPTYPDRGLITKMAASAVPGEGTLSCVPSGDTACTVSVPLPSLGFVLLELS